VALGVAPGAARARRAEQGLVVVASRGGGRGVAAVAERGAPVAPRGGVHADVAGQAEARAVLGAVEERAQRGAAGAGDVVAAHASRLAWIVPVVAAPRVIGGWWRPIDRRPVRCEVIDDGGGGGSMPWAEYI
jgi:hypothetical protein